MNKFIDQISCLENLMLAWRKLERAFTPGDVWFDSLVISAFKMNLVENLREISKKINEGKYQMKPIHPIPFPKGGKDENDCFKVRQSFYIDFRDQLVWVAVFNVIGRYFDVLMPAWSFGNRQYISMWKESEDDVQYWVLGNYRNTTNNIYRKWTQSWPLMRKRITASVKKMARLDDYYFDDIDKQVFSDETHLRDKHDFFKLNYLKADYFPHCKPISELYWVSLDLTQFYQKVKIDIVRSKILSLLKQKEEFDSKFESLLNAITCFKIDYKDYQYDGAENDLEAMQLTKSKDIVYSGLPTGLIVAHTRDLKYYTGN